MKKERYERSEELSEKSKDEGQLKMTNNNEVINLGFIFNFFLNFNRMN